MLLNKAEESLNLIKKQSPWKSPIQKVKFNVQQLGNKINISIYFGSECKNNTYIPETEYMYFSHFQSF